MLILQLMLRNIIRIAIPNSRLPGLVAPRDSRLNKGTCTENDNVSSDVNPTTNVEENNNDSDDQVNDNISCLEKKKN